jgi:transcriptional regulator with XRE-family HTH domain
MPPFGDTVLSWRLRRGLTQEALARRARVPRPNLSAIERGRREASLRTVRALALALDVRPGLLVDGIAPGEEVPLSRETMERIADAAVQKKRLSDPNERALVEQITHLVGSRLRASQAGRRSGARLGRRSDRAWLSLAPYSPVVIQSLVNRIVERGRSR